VSLRPLRVSLEFTACAVTTAWLFVRWLWSPVLDRVTFFEWQLVGVTAAVAFGVGGFLATGSTSRVSSAVAVGLLVGAYNASWGDDVAHTLFSRVAEGLARFGFEAALFFGSAVAGAVAAAFVLRRRRAVA